MEDDLSIAELEAAGLRLPTPCGGSRSSSTATSTSGARRRPGCGCRRRRSARTVVCRSPTAGPASSSPGEGRVKPTLRRRGGAGRRGAALRRHVPAGARRARRHHAVRVPPRSLRHRHADPGPGRDPRAAHAWSGPADAGARRTDRRRDPVRWLRDADHRLAVHVAVDVGVHHRAVRRHHADHRVGDQPAAAAAAGDRRHRDRDRSACTCSPAPTCTSGAARCSRSRARCCSRSTSCTSARTRTCCARCSSRRCRSARSRCCRSRPPAQQGVGSLSALGGVRGRVHRHRVLGGRAAAAALGPAADPREPRRADPARRAGVRRDRRAT